MEIKFSAQADVFNPVTLEKKTNAKKIFSICIYVISYSKYFQEYFVIIHFFHDNYIYILYILLCFQVENFFLVPNEVLTSNTYCHLRRAELQIRIGIGNFEIIFISHQKCFYPQ